MKEKIPKIGVTARNICNECLGTGYKDKMTVDENPPKKRENCTYCAGTWNKPVDVYDFLKEER